MEKICLLVNSLPVFIILPVNKEGSYKLFCYGNKIIDQWQKLCSMMETLMF